VRPVPRQPLQDPELRVKLALQKQAAERAQQRRKWIKLAGSLAFFVSPFPVFVIDAPALLLLPAGIGASIAFFGMTMTDHRRDLAEWGFTLPSKCLGYGMAPFLLIGFAQPIFIVALLGWTLIAWLLTLLAASTTASIIDHWFYNHD
jgi:hypothetical protein